MPVSDSFWNEHYPPNGWGCRCSVIEVLKSQYEETPQKDVKEKSKNIFPTEKDKIFAYNPGKAVAPFPPKHPYYKVQNSLAVVIKNEALDLWARTHAREIADNVIKNNKEIIGKSFNMQNIGEPVLIVKNTFTKNLRYGTGFTKRIAILENLESIIPKLKYEGKYIPKKEDFTAKQWKNKKEIKAYHFFNGEFESIKFQIDIEERYNKLNNFYNIKILQ